VARVVRDVQSRYWRAPDLSSGMPGRSSKYR
jgi:hypothetical protein